MKTVLLDKTKHDRKRFDCCVASLNNYLKVQASQQARKDNARTYVLEDPQNESRIIGFYTLTMARLDLENLPPRLRKKHRFSTSVGLIARLAVDKKHKHNGFGEWLLIDALKKLLQASQIVAFPLVIVDAKDGSEKFYKKYGFTAFQEAQNKLFITTATLKATLPITTKRGSAER
jgi:GNAT superfamily N-acetyltransferase